MKSNKTLRILQKLLVLVFICPGCSPEMGVSPHNDNLIAQWSFQYNHDITLMQKINSVAYDKNSHSTLIAFEPVHPSQPNIIKLKFSPVKDNLLQTKPAINMAQITHGPIRQIRVSPNGTYTAFAGRTKELVLLKNNSKHITFLFDKEITSIVFNNKNVNVLAVGDRGGKVTLIDLDKRSITKTFQMFKGEITSLTFSKKNQLIVTGNDSQIIQLDTRSGEIIRRIDTWGFKEKAFRLAGLKTCSMPRINQVLYIEPYSMIITSHGWDYCDDYRIRIWDGESGSHITDIYKHKSPVFQMVWVPKFQSLVFVDHSQNLWKFSLDDFNLLSLGNLLHTMTRYASIKKEAKIHTLLGNINSMISVAETPYLLLGAGSYFKAGPAVLWIELTGNSFKHIANLVFNNKGIMTSAVAETLLNEKEVTP